MAATVLYYAALRVRTPTVVAVLHVRDDVPYHRSMLAPVLAQRRHWLAVDDSSAERPEEACDAGEFAQREQQLEAYFAARRYALFFGDYDYMPWQQITTERLRASCYCTRKGLTRKAHLAYHMEKLAAKSPPHFRQLIAAVPPSYALELFHPEYVDEVMCDLPLAVVEARQRGTKWLCKLSVVEKAKDVLLFDELPALQRQLEHLADEGVREFVVQRYIDRPYLVKSGRKFSMRVYALCLGDLQVLVWRDVFCFVAVEPFDQPQPPPTAYITNFNINRHHPAYLESHCSFLLPQLLPTPDLCAAVVDQIRAVTAQLFASMRNEPVSFFPLPHCYELYGIDFLLDADAHVWLLEVNAGPDLTHLGSLFFDIGVELYDSIFRLAVDPVCRPPARPKPAKLAFSLPVTLSDDDAARWTSVYVDQRSFTL